MVLDFQGLHWRLEEGNLRKPELDMCVEKVEERDGGRVDKY